VLYFFINMPLDELIKLEEKLPKGSYCLLQIQTGSTRYYGIIKKDAYPVLIESVSPETKQNLETLEKTVFQHFFLQNASDNITFLGNRRLIMYLSDSE
jgi:hypothetical protein